MSRLLQFSQGVAANVLGVLATSFLFVRVISENNQYNFGEYVYDIAIINTIAAVFGNGISNFVLRNWDCSNLRLPKQALCTCLFSLPLSLISFALFAKEPSLAALIALTLLTVKNSLSSVLRARLEFNSLLMMSLLEACTVLAFYLYLLSTCSSISWQLMLAITYGASVSFLIFQLRKDLFFQINSDKTFFLSTDLYVFFLLTAIQNFGTYGERFVTEFFAGETIMTLIFRETYAYKLGLTVSTVLATVIMSYLGKMTIDQLKNGLNHLVPGLLTVSIALSLTLFILRGRLNDILLLYRSEIPTKTNILLVVAFCFLYVSRLVKPLLLKFGSRRSIIFQDLSFSVVFIFFLLFFNSTIDMPKYGLALLIASIVSLLYSTTQLSRVLIPQAN